MLEYCEVETRLLMNYLFLFMSIANLKSQWGPGELRGTMLLFPLNRLRDSFLHQRAEFQSFFLV